MRFIAFALIAATSVCAQSTNFAGVWRADLQNTKVMGPPLKDYVDWIEQTGTKVDEKILTVNPYGGFRSELQYTTDGKPSIHPYDGVPTRETAVSDGAALVVTLETDGRPDTAKRRYELSGDGQKLTINVDASAEGRQFHSVYVLTRQPESAAEALQQPEKLASDLFKNLKTSLKDLPASEFVDRMHYFSWALNQNCEFCHVQGHFDSDDKKEKRTARGMIDLVAHTNQDFFRNKPEVNCYTCHEFRSHPQSRPRFEGEPEHHHDEHEQHD